ncbi:alpha/beta fold hydrolase [Virgisporangium aurantiacum]|uniref:Alpha/beta hydrolase n=1 Tax=Virgisporangium aurantiacum TaxID=175570 RepID=A0A8J4E5J0_9ACTN|nr:alpha/beta fold hydrolase [Virgisporangium aurantiacum]GIJ62154.1 alpha/beta hydrolase [Virgisporangium aurantiacum]
MGETVDATGAGGGWVEQVTAPDGISLHAEGGGDGPPVVMVHGLGYASWAAEPIRPILSREHTFVTYDNRGSGRSDKPDGPYSIRLLAEDAVAVIERLCGQSHLIGYSMGGYIALTVALRRPDLVSSLVLIATSGGGGHATDVPEQTRRAWDAASGLPPGPFARETMPLSFRPGWTDERPQDFEDILRRRLAFPTPPAAWRAQYGACADYLGSGVHVERVSAPTLIIHGTADRVVPLPNAFALVGAIPDARLCVLTGAGHLTWFEQPDRVADLISEFYRSLRRTTTAVTRP